MIRDASAAAAATAGTPTRDATQASRLRCAVGYLVTDFMRSHRYFAPGAAFCVALAVAYAAPRPMPVLSSYAFSSSIVFVGSSWLALLLASTEGAVAQDITATHAGGHGLPSMARVLASLVVGLTLCAIALLYPIASWAFLRLPTGRETAIGVVAHLCAAGLGCSLGLNWAPPLASNHTRSWGGLALCWVLAFAAGAKPLQWVLPPMSPIVGYMLGGARHAPAALCFGCPTAWTLLSFAVYRRRRSAARVSVSHA